MKRRRRELGLCILGSLLCWAGCSSDSPKLPTAANETLASSSPEPVEPSFAEQLAAVSRGETNTIRVTAGAVGPAEFEQLSSLAPSSKTANGVLQELLLDEGVVTDREIAVVASLSTLEHLRLRASPLTDVGAEILGISDLPVLRVMNLPQAKFSAKGIAALGKLPKLQQLRLGGPQIDDAAVARLSELPELRSLHLIGPKLTDEALVMIAKLPKLSSFYLDDCSLSDAAWEQFFTARPTLHVHIDQAHHDRDPNMHE